MQLKIKDIRSNMKLISVVARIIEKGESREVTTKYGPASVSWATLEDETGKIRLNLWRGQISAVKVGDVIRLENAFVRSFKETLELNVGSDGKIVVTDD